MQGSRSIVVAALALGILSSCTTVADPREASQPLDGCPVPAGAVIDNAAVPDGFCAWHWAGDLGAPRGIVVDDDGDVLVLSRWDASVVLLHDDDGDGASGPGERVTLAQAPGLNHGLAIKDDHLYASSDTTVYLWVYAGDRAPLGDPEVVIDGIPGGGSHTTRTLAFDEAHLYVSVGSAGNVDADSSRARVARFAIEDLGGSAIGFGEGEVFADGLRNEVGLAFDSRGRLWGVENGQDQLRRRDFDPPDIHEDNPAEELNLFAETGRFYGYPYCWSEFSLPSGQGLVPGTQVTRLEQNGRGDTLRLEVGSQEWVLETRIAQLIQVAPENSGEETE